MTDYRVQEYTLDQGVFCKSGIYSISRTLYMNCNNDSKCRRLVILPGDDVYGNTLPATVRSWNEMQELVNKFEAREAQEQSNERINV